MKLHIDGTELEVEPGVSLLEAARRVRVEIPTLCFREGYDHYTSCMLCVVKDRKSGRILPSCSARAEDGMDIETQSEEIRAFRKSTLELLLSEHVGDCEAPCQRLCALHAEIPAIIRDIQGNRLDLAAQKLRRDVPLAGVVERLCHAPCEKGCRRGQVDAGVSIQQLMRHVADADLQRPTLLVEDRPPPSGRRVAVIGAGVTGLATAMWLARDGHAVTVFESASRVLDRLQREKGPEVLPAWVVEGEFARIRQLGVEFRLGARVGTDVSMLEVRARHDAVILACGSVSAEELTALGLPASPKGVTIDPATSMTRIEGVFAGGDVLKKETPILKCAQQARGMAACVSQLLRGLPMQGMPEGYNHTMGRLRPEELAVFAGTAAPDPRTQPSQGAVAGFNATEAATECGRCLHCDCRASHDCSLRRYSDEYGASQSGFKGEERGRYTQVNQQGGVIYEPGKCLKCGLCVRITRCKGERYGFTFVGRGFEVRAAVALDKTLEEGLRVTADEVVDACPTGALAHKVDPA